MDKINQYKGMFAVKYSCDVTSRPAIIDFGEFKHKVSRPLQKKHPWIQAGVIFHTTRACVCVFVMFVVWAFAYVL